ncbi:MAG: mechanosensitive ion channel [Planctomycetota bacterium]|nr:mechanosensitive ion channel [Planctomycetota bacterium]
MTSWQELVSERRRQEAEKAKLEAENLRRKAAQEIPRIRKFAERNEILAGQRVNENGVRTMLDRVDQELAETVQKFESLRGDFSSAKRKVKAAGLTNAMGFFLRKQYEHLPQIPTLKQQIRARRELISDAQYQTILLEEERAQYGDVERLVKELVEGQADPLGLEDLTSMKAVSRELYTQRRKLLDALIQDYDRYFNKLLELNTVTNKYILTTQNYQNFIEEHILWVRSVTGSTLPDLEEAGKATVWFLSPKRWMNGVSNVPDALAKRWLESLIGLVLILFAFSTRFWARKTQETLHPVANASEDRFSWTFYALLLTAVRAIPFPLLLYATAQALTTPTNQSAPVLVMGAALIEVSLSFFILELFRKAFAADGLANKHFLCPVEACQTIRRNLGWFTPIWLTLTLIVSATEIQTQNNLWNDSLGRIAFGLSQLSLALLLHRILRPSGPVLAPVLVDNPDGMFNRLRYVGYPAAIGLPILLILLSVRGYHYSALRLEEQSLTTLWFALSLGLVNAFYFRWLRLATQRVILQQGDAVVAGGVVSSNLTAVETPVSNTAAEPPVVEPSIAEPSAAESTVSAVENRALIPGVDDPEPPVPSEGFFDATSPSKALESADATALPEPTVSAPEDAQIPDVIPPAELSPKQEVENNGLLFEAPPVEEEKVAPPPPVDLEAMDKQARDLIRSFTWIALLLGIYFIWFSVLPALNKLKQVQVWPQIKFVDAQAPILVEKTTPTEVKDESKDKDGSSTKTLSPIPKMPTSSVEPGKKDSKSDVVTLAEVFLAIVFFISTIVGGRNLPALLDMVLLQRLSVDSGGRYAMTTMSRYGIYMIGMSLTFGSLGISWSSVQWLAAALTFGLAFGLQEIFANFVAGIILFFERPIRVGDIVTVGDLSGVVTRIQIRATTVRSFERKELIVPNKSFVTDRVLNWGLTDSILRVVIPIGLAYGSDTKRARELLLEIARSHPDVLSEPKTTAYFLGYGASTLDFELRIFVPKADRLAPTKHDILQSIGQRFADENIEIAFPQLDLHLKSADPLKSILTTERQGHLFPGGG